MNATPVLRLMKNMQHLPDDKILLAIEIEHLTSFVNRVNGVVNNGIDLCISQGVLQNSYTIGPGILLPFIKKAINNKEYMNRHRVVEVYLNPNKTLLFVTVKMAAESVLVNENNNLPRFIITHKLVTTCLENSDS
jgi:hypothetical protein